MEKPTCLVAGCVRPVRCKDRCRRHYDQWRRNTPLSERLPLTLKERILAKVDRDANGCWLWTGHLGETGYGQVRANGGTHPAHRMAYEAWKGSLPEHLEPDHVCRIRRCVNPEHLEAVPHRENLMRGRSFAAVNARKTHCPQRHPYAGDNLIIKVDGKGNRGRICRTCRDARNRARFS